MNTTRKSTAVQLSFALYGAANRMARLHKPLLAPLGLTFPQYLAMLELLNEAPVSVGVLGQRLGMDTGTITPLVKRLDAAGLATRTRDPHDERRVIVDLTASGRALETDIRSVTGKIRTLCNMTERGMDALVQTLETLAHPVQD